ncbi:50S ribosomal protein L33 [Mycoplasmopsis adleri]|uniref:50S ribosomal protein L33 n=1 Tax=Mycoplasmopsis adleri TaxID=51362 RepID=UPI0038734CF2
MLKKKISLSCEECHKLNYSTSKSLSSSANRIMIKKYCPNCKKHTLHKEEK